MGASDHAEWRLGFVSPSTSELDWLATTLEEKMRKKGEKKDKNDKSLSSDIG